MTQNNARDALIQVKDRAERCCTTKASRGRKRQFVRRAVEDDKNLQVVILQRTAENKYLRLDVGKQDELIGGFPKTREELFVVSRASSSAASRPPRSRLNSSA